MNTVSAPALLTARWDAFLEHTRLGQFQQTNRWARLKALDGWQAQPLYLNPHQPEEGGLQLLWKSTRFGRIGYVSKGPVLPSEDRFSVDAILGQLTAVARTLGLRALILQPPDQSGISSADLHRHSFSPDPVTSVIRATATIDVSGGRDSFLPRMNRQVRREARLAIQRGVTARLGGRDDLPRFFQLMSLSCQRQHVAPNPARLESLEALWDEFSPQVLLGLTEVRGETVAGLLMVGHGRRLTFWKKGWDSHDTQSFANCLLNVEALGWACDHGYTLVDFAGLAPDIAETLVAGGMLSEPQKRSRDMFNLRLGAVPDLLPPARLLVINPAVRQIYALCRQSSIIEKWLMQRLGSG